LKEYIEGSNTDVYVDMIGDIKKAISMAIKRCKWNYKTAIPKYYPRYKRIDLLIPLCLVANNKVDVALVVEKGQGMQYLGHTVIPLDWAYSQARLVCRPDSDWLSPAMIELSEIVTSEM
jgi:hypothetical protein